MNINPQMIMQLQQMVQQGMAWKDILMNFKKQGMSPQLIEDMLCTAFPQIKRAKQAIANSGMSTQDYLGQLMKQNNISMEQMNNMFGNFQ